MKSKKGLIGLVVIVAVLVLGIGYAVISSVNLTVTGTAAAKERDLDVVISAASPTVAPTIGAVSNPVDKSATFTVTDLENTSDTRTITYTVKNNDEVAADVYLESASNIVFATAANAAYYDDTTSITGSANKITVPAGGTNTFTVTVKLKKVPTEEANSNSGTVTITITAAPVTQ